MTDLNTQQTKALDALFQQAITLHQVGQINEAEQLYRRILQTYPKHVDANYNLGLIANMAGHLEAGLKHVQLAYDAFPGNTQFVLTYASSLANLGYLLDALKVVKTARKQAGDSDELKKMQRQIDDAIQLSLENPSPTQKEWESLTELFRAQKWQELETRANRLSAQYKRSGKVWNMLAMALQAQGKDFLDTKRKAAEFSPLDINLQISLSADLQRSGRLDEAEELLKNQVKKHPDSALSHYNLAVFSSSMNRSLEAMSSLKRSLEINPEFISALCAMGQLLVKSGHIEQATEKFQRAMAIQTGNADEICILAQTLLNVGQTEAAAAQFKRALDINPQHLNSLNDMGITLKTLGYPEDAEKCFYRAVEVQPNFVVALNNLGQMRYESSDFGNAEVCFRRTLALEPNNVIALCAMGAIMLKLGKFPEAIQILNQALSLTPSDPLIHCNLGLCYRGLGQIEAALQSYQNAIRCRPDFAFAYGNCGDIHGFLGQSEQAEQAFSRALELDPHDLRIVTMALAHIPYRADDPRFAQLENLYANRSGYANTERQIVCTVYAKAMQQCGENDKADAALAEAAAVNVSAK